MLNIFFISLFISLIFLLQTKQQHHCHTEVNKEEQKKSDILNEINIEKYKDELMEYQRLQRENLMLKLRLENRTLEKSLGVDSFIPEGVKLVAIMSSGAGSLRAKNL
ncbi:periplasmic protein [Escherichia coli]|uniref:Periplasmic protein n=1 Tax=Escherichia coli TaxID=562 RepID=A0A485JR57_ECOLX|nr:periplasmic protein [Escherichia coli]